MLDSVQVWGAWLDVPTARLAQLAAALSPEERSRAARFVFARDRRAYIACRGILRNILAFYVGLAPEALIFDYNSYGKPSLVPDCGGNRLHFNVSHSASLALFVVRAGGEVGIDVEQVRQLPDLYAIAASTFSSAENAALQSLPEYQHTEAFFTCWTRKEAFIKAVGTGLSYPLKDFDVTVRPGDAAHFLRIAGEETDKWSLIDLRPAAGFIGAIAVPTPNASVQFDWWDSSSDNTQGRQSKDHHKMKEIS